MVGDRQLDQEELALAVIVLDVRCGANKISCIDLEYAQWYVRTLARGETERTRLQLLLDLLYARMFRHHNVSRTTP